MDILNQMKQQVQYEDLFKYNQSLEKIFLPNERIYNDPIIQSMKKIYDNSNFFKLKDISESLSIPSALENSLVFTNIDHLEWMYNPSQWALPLDNFFQEISDMNKRYLGMDFTNRLLESIDISGLEILEKQTAKILENFNESLKLTSVAYQFDNWYKSFELHNIASKWKDLIAPTKLLSDYAELVKREHSYIQKTNIFTEGHLSILDVTAKYFDRELGWASEMIANLAPQVDEGEELIDEEVMLGELETKSTVSKIPTYISYSLRRDSNILVEEAFASSILIEVTERGKGIIDSVSRINQLCEALGREPILKLTNMMLVQSCMLGKTSCTSKDELGIVIDALYCIFYENLERIKRFVGEDMVRGGEEFDCIFGVKHIRTEFRHDYEHGNEREIEKKTRKIISYYKRYCGLAAPIKEKDYLILQRNLYIEIENMQMFLIEKLIEMERA